MSEWVTMDRTDPNTMPVRGQTVDLYDKMFDKIYKSVLIDCHPDDIDLDITEWRRSSVGRAHR